MNQQFLGDNALSELLYERLITKANSVGFDSSTKNHVFITGLARAGTTAILNQLYKSGLFQEGSIRPKIKAALHFLKYHGEKVMITSIPCIKGALNGKAGTEIRKVI